LSEVVSSGTVWWSKTTYLTAGSERENKEGIGVSLSLSRACPRDLRPSTNPHFLKVPPPPNSTTLDDHAFNKWAFGKH
jgi:hypothetical protein